MAAEVMHISVLRNYPQAAIYWKDESGTRIDRMQDFRSLEKEHQPGM